jgi:hypothetical protein
MILVAGLTLRFRQYRANLDAVSRLLTTVGDADMNRYLTGMRNRNRADPSIGDFTATDLLRSVRFVVPSSLSAPSPSLTRRS